MWTLKSPLCLMATGVTQSGLKRIHRRGVLKQNGKGYAGHFAYDEDLDLFQGSVSNIKDLILFQGKSVDAVIEAFKDSINEYIDWCEKMGKEPEKPFSED